MKTPLIAGDPHQQPNPSSWPSQPAAPQNDKPQPMPDNNRTQGA